MSGNKGILAYLMNDEEEVKDCNIAVGNVDMNRKYKLCIALFGAKSKIALIDST